MDGLPTHAAVLLTMDGLRAHGATLLTMALLTIMAILTIMAQLTMGTTSMACLLMQLCTTYYGLPAHAAVHYLLWLACSCSCALLTMARLLMQLFTLLLDFIHLTPLLLLLPFPVPKNR